MAKVSAVGLGTEAGKLILQDFKNWKRSGFKPWVQKGLGGIAHWRSCTIYRSLVTPAAFRSQAKKIAAIALEQMPAEEIAGGGEANDENLPNDSENKNPWERTEYGSDEAGDGENDFDDNYDEGEDEDFVAQEDDKEEGDNELDADFEKVAITELQDLRALLIIRYPNGKKVGIVFVCDGDVKDVTSNYFEFGNNNMKLKRWSRIPQERTQAVDLIGTSKDDIEFQDFGFSDADSMVLDREIQKRLKGTKVDENGFRWEIRDELDLPFPCKPVLYNKQGKTIKNYIMRRNRKGFTCGFFWLVVAPKKKETKRMDGSKVTLVDDSSVYTDENICP